MDELAAVMIGLAFAGVAFLVAFVLPIVSFITVRRTRDTVRRLERRVDGLEAMVRNARARTETLRPPVVGPSAAAEPAAAVVFTPAAAAPPGPPPVVSPREPAAVAAAESSAEPRSAEPEHAPVPAVEAAILTIAETQPPRDVPTPEPSHPAETFESRVGGRGLLYVGAVALLLGLAFFVKYAFDNEWITETARVVLGGLAGLGLVAGGGGLDRRGYRQYGQVLAGIGFVALYISTFAAVSFYALISQTAAFGLMVFITAGSAAMADRLASQGLAMVAVVGGFATPFLVGGDEDAQVTLLTYDAILVAGTIFLARRRAWPYLILFAYAASVLTFFVWAEAYYEPAKFVPTQVFLVVFCTLFLFGWHLLRREAGRANAERVFSKEAVDVVTLILGSAPVAFHVASLLNLGRHPLAYLVYLLVFTLAGIVAGVRLDRPWVRGAVFLGVAPLLVTWIVEHRTPGWMPASIVGLLASYLLHLGGQWEWTSRHEDTALTKPDVLLFHANGLALAGGAYALTWDWPLAWPVGLALLQAAWHGSLSWITRRWRQDVAPNALALMFAMIGLAIGLAWDGWPAIVAWMVEAAAIIWVGLRTRQGWMRIGGIALSGWLLVVTLFNDFFDTPAGFTIFWNARVGAVAALIAVLYAIAALYRRAEADLPNEAPGMRAAYLIAANVVTVLLASVEINSYWHARVGFDAAANLALRASLSILWALDGTVLIVAGIMRRYRPIRYLAIALLSITILKVFLSDLYQLGGIYRIAGFLGLGGFLLLGAWLYQRYKAIIIGEEQ